MTEKRQIVSNNLLLIFVLPLLAGLLSACGAMLSEAPSSSQAVSSDEAIFVEEELAGEAAPAEPSLDYADGESIPVEDFLANAVSQQETRVIIYTGNIALVVKETEATVAAITQLADEQGGYVSNSNVYRSGEALRGSISIRVPADQYQQTLAQLRDLALRVERESSSTEDVTEEFTDLQARRTNLEFSEAALQKLLDERSRVGSTSDILEVQRELTNIRGQIEQIEGRMRFLANRAALSTINVELTPDILYQPISVAGWEPRGVAREAFQALIAALQGLINVVIWLIVFVLPLLIIFLIPVVLAFMAIRFGWRRYQSRKKQSPPTKSPSSDSGKK